MKILAIENYFDDIELGCGGTLAKHIKQGDKVLCLLQLNQDLKIMKEN